MISVRIFRICWQSTSAKFTHSLLMNRKARSVHGNQSPFVYDKKPWNMKVFLRCGCTLCMNTIKYSIVHEKKNFLEINFRGDMSSMSNTSRKTFWWRCVGTKKCLWKIINNLKRGDMFLVGNNDKKKYGSDPQIFWPILTILHRSCTNCRYERVVYQLWPKFC